MLKLLITTKGINTMETIVNGMRPIHPGEILREEFLIPLSISAHALSMALQVPAPRINEIVRERRSVTVDTALRLSKYLGTSAEFWLGLQTDYDMAIARATMGDALARIARCERTVLSA
jgi:antitoxin HigA-1